MGVPVSKRQLYATHASTLHRLLNLSTRHRHYGIDHPVDAYLMLIPNWWTNLANIPKYHSYCTGEQRTHSSTHFYSTEMKLICKELHSAGFICLLLFYFLATSILQEDQCSKTSLTNHLPRPTDPIYRALHLGPKRSPKQYYCNGIIPR